MTVDQSRVRPLNMAPVNRRGEYVLYWMQSAQRTRFNHALEYAVQQANLLGRGVLVFFGLTDDYPGANLRHYRFMLEGLREIRPALERRGIPLVLWRCHPPEGVIELARDACCVIVDEGSLRHQRQWRHRVAVESDRPVCEVTTNLVVPVDEASTKEEFSAGTFRPRITRQLERYLVPLRAIPLRQRWGDCPLPSFDIEGIDAALALLHVDRSVLPVATPGGTSHALRALKRFIGNGLDRYHLDRNDPAAEIASGLSPYLHFGQISPVEVALEVAKAGSPGGKDFLEQLIVRRELAHNFVHFNQAYDCFDAVPHWAKRTLGFHEKDIRDPAYSLADLEAARTADPYWNAAQMEMVLTGHIHPYMRMYWGKKIIEWTGSLEGAYSAAVGLNDKYELDGRDPNGYAGIAWCFGKHDRPWAERAVFGKVRYMNAAGLRRKFRIDAYVERIRSLMPGQPPFA